MRTVTLTVADNGKTEPVDVRVGDLIEVRLPAKLSTGYLWLPIPSLPSALQEQPKGGSNAVDPDKPPLGAEEEQVTVYKVVAPATEPVVLGLAYARPFAKPKKWDVLIKRGQKPWDTELRTKVVGFRVPLRIVP
jgi:hypothetical protein